MVLLGLRSADASIAQCKLMISRWKQHLMYVKCDAKRPVKLRTHPIVRTSLVD